MNAMERIWFGIFGPPEELIVDGEGGIALSESTRTRLGRHGVTLHVRAKDQHARYAERRGALLRDALHRIHSQLQEEGLTLPFESVLSEATFCGNAMLTVGGNTPYNAVLGRVPRMLPSIDQIRSPVASESSQSTLEHTHRPWKDRAGHGQFDQQDDTYESSDAEYDELLERLAATNAARSSPCSGDSRGAPSPASLSFTS